MIFFEHYFVISKIFYFYIKNQFVLFVENRLHLFEKILFFFYFFYKINKQNLNINFVEYFLTIYNLIF